MANPDGELTVAQRLGRALDRGLLPAGGPAEAAERLIERLERPARIALMGLPGSGKSSILNLLVGAVVVPETLRLPTIIVQHGNVSRMICTLTDGSTKILPGQDLAEVLPLAPALVTLELDLPALRVISLLEVSAGPLETEQKRAATWASKRSDIVIWCSTSYLPKEQAVWESLPDSVKDNSFMFLTKIDLLGSRDSAAAMHDRVELRAGEEFRQILSISAKQARLATPPGGSVNRDLFRDSGASSVIAAIKTRVQSGRRADMDTAELLLARHVEATELVARRFAETLEPTEPTRVWTPPPDPQDGHQDTEVDRGRSKAEVDDGAIVAHEEPAAGFSAPSDSDRSAGNSSGSDQDANEPAEADEPDPIDADMAAKARFADRIRRAAGIGEAGAPTPSIPLKTTWKSKSELDAPPAMQPSEVRPSEPVRRPRPPAPSNTDELEGLSKIVSNMVSSSAPSTEPQAAPGQDPDRSADDSARQHLSDEGARAGRPQLFGGRRPLASGTPLPDLSNLRATPEEIAASAEARAKDDAPDDASANDAADWNVGTTEGPLEPRARVSRLLPDEDDVHRSRTAAPQPQRDNVSRVRSVLLGPLGVTSSTEGLGAQGRAQESPFTARSIISRERPPEPEAAPRRERPRVAVRAVPVVEAASATAISNSEQSLVDEALALIMSRSSELEREIDVDAKVPVDLILDHARETGEQVQAVVSRGQSEPLRRINSDLGEVMDLIMLMQLEKGHAPADDALTLLLQLKRELETLSAA